MIYLSKNRKENYDLFTFDLFKFKKMKNYTSDIAFSPAVKKMQKLQQKRAEIFGFGSFYLECDE